MPGGLAELGVWPAAPVVRRRGGRARCPAGRGARVARAAGRRSPPGRPPGPSGVGHPDRCARRDVRRRADDLHAGGALRPARRRARVAGRALLPRPGRRRSRAPIVVPSGDLPAAPPPPVAFTPDAPRWNVLWIVLDSWRADAMTPALTPVAEALARRSSVFLDHTSGGDATRYGLVSMFYGLPASAWSRLQIERRSPPLLATLAARGWRLGVCHVGRHAGHPVGGLRGRARRHTLRRAAGAPRPEGSRGDRSPRAVRRPARRWEAVLRLRPPALDALGVRPRLPAATDRPHPARSLPARRPLRRRPGGARAARGVAARYDRGPHGRPRRGLRRGWRVRPRRRLHDAAAPRAAGAPRAGTRSAVVTHPTTHHDLAATLLDALGARLPSPPRVSAVRCPTARRRRCCSPAT